MIRLKCPMCDGIGKFAVANGSTITETTCPVCSNGKNDGRVPLFTWRVVRSAIREAFKSITYNTITKAWQ